MALRNEIEAILNQEDQRTRIQNVLREGQRQPGDTTPQPNSIALLLQSANAQNQAILRLAEEFEQIRSAHE